MASIFYWVGVRVRGDESGRGSTCNEEVGLLFMRGSGKTVRPPGGRGASRKLQRRREREAKKAKRAASQRGRPANQTSSCLRGDGRGKVEAPARVDGGKFPIKKARNLRNTSGPDMCSGFRSMNSAYVFHVL